MTSGTPSHFEGAALYSMLDEFNNCHPNSEKNNPQEETKVEGGPAEHQGSNIDPALLTMGVGRRHDE